MPSITVVAPVSLSQGMYGSQLLFTSARYLYCINPYHRSKSAWCLPRAATHSQTAQHRPCKLPTSSMYLPINGLLVCGVEGGGVEDGRQVT